jgi:phage tail tape-measure protein
MHSARTKTGIQGQAGMGARTVRSTLGFREGVLSAAVFGAILFALVSVDPRVEAQVTDLLRSASATSLSDRLGDLGGALWSAARDHSIDQAPLLVFATVGTVLTLAMLKS